jgi:hypothetical protein
MAIPERDTVYTNDGTNRSVYTRESSSTGWFVGIIVALALLAIGYLVFSANSGPSTSVDTNSTTLEAPVTPAPDTSATPMTEAPAGDNNITVNPATPAPSTDSTAPSTDVAPMTEAPAASDAAPVEAAPATEAPAVSEPAPAAGDTTAPAAPAAEPAPAAGQ